MRGLLAALALGPLAAAGEPWALHVIDDFSSGADGARLGDVNGDGRPDIVTGWEEGGFTRLYVNPGPARVREKWPAVTVGRTPNVEDAMFTDLDGDGMLDVVSACEGKTKSIIVHWAPGDGDELLDAEAWRGEVLPASDGRMMWMFAVPMQVDGKHGVDLVAAGKGSGAELGWFEAPEDGRDLAGYSYHPICKVGWVMSIRTTDMDGDGDADVLISDRKGADAAVRWLENPGSGARQSDPWASHVVYRQPVNGVQYMFLDTGDLDRDGLEDVACCLFRGSSALVPVRRLDRTGKRWEETVVPLEGFGMGRAKAAGIGDLDGDGRPDIALSCETSAGKHGVAWFSADDGPFSDRWTFHPVSGVKRGIKFDRIELLDLDADGDLDLLTCEENDGPGSRGLGVIWYENPGN